MTLILRACASIPKRFFHEDFNHLGRTLTYITSNSSLKRFPVVYHTRCFSTGDHEEASKGLTEIYYGSLTRQIKSLKIFSLLTSAGGLLFQPFIYTKAVEMGNTEAVIGIFATISCFAVSTPILLNFVTKKYVTYMYYDADKDKYIANTYSLFVRTKKLEFTPDDVVVPEVTGMFTNCIIKGTPLYLEQNFFYDSSHFIRIMGYDKPVDFKLNVNSSTVDETISADCRDNVNRK